MRPGVGAPGYVKPVPRLQGRAPASPASTYLRDPTRAGGRRGSVQRRGYPPRARRVGQAAGLSGTSSVAHQLRVPAGFHRRGGHQRWARVPLCSSGRKRI
ncbi:hypothetical protein [Streptomyces sp. NBC_01518]